ncbi:hypothetical protein SAMN05216188_101884 [Lentzea xinjiangensis]|uniref:DUF3558 domain-containing protein n=1 Tax=Lentzea xinjiangensis TaxID=402600 RepID=A0A1H9BQF0_9PSEU|nr:hypothetical protein [Lentzea xinjiangensis]SEP91176.1 hypothetical protein SAMN05216188_101884 [Lentzea xinjiangensis]
MTGERRGPLVVALVITGLLAIDAGVIAYVRDPGVVESHGTPKRDDALPSLCRNISEAALARARTTNPNGQASSEQESGTGKYTVCSWNQTEGVDGTGLRKTRVAVSSDLRHARIAYEQAVQQARRGTTTQRTIDDLGDQASLVRREENGTVSIIVWKGDSVTEVVHSGRDADRSGSVEPDPEELEAAALPLAREMVAGL